MNADQFAAALVLEGYADNTVRLYRCMYQRWCDYAATYGRDPHRPDPLAVRAWASGLAGGAGILSQARAAIKHLCRMLKVDDVSTAIRLPRRPRRPRSRSLTQDQARQLARTADRMGQAGLAVLVGLYTGARRSEIASLSWDRIDLDQGWVTLDRTKMMDTHHVELAPALWERLLQRHVPDLAWVFPGRYGGHVAPAMVWEWTKQVASEAGVGNITTHQLRHTLISTLYDISRDPYAAQQVAGHTDPTVTAGYSTRTSDQIRQALGEIDWLDDSA